MLYITISIRTSKKGDLNVAIVETNHHNPKYLMMYNTMLCVENGWLDSIEEKNKQRGGKEMIVLEKPIKIPWITDPSKEETKRVRIVRNAGGVYKLWNGGGDPVMYEEGSSAKWLYPGQTLMIRIPDGADLWVQADKKVDGYCEVIALIPK